ncbi:hypothetical protein [Neptunicella sp.]|uniref:hypothetical protein n=1 Tax=Neptunicella sp. TaxID=2125986 RepID=UPI003F68C95E
MSERIYYFPFNHVNRYVDLTKQTLTDIGYEVLSYRHLYRFNNLLKRQENTVVLNWFEDRPYRKSFSSKQQRLELLRTTLGIVLMRLFCRRVIWVRHNYLPHNLASSSEQNPDEKKPLVNKLPQLPKISIQRQHTMQKRQTPRPLSHRINCFLLHHLASEVVCMEPTDFATAIVPHPLYRSDHQLQDAISTAIPFQAEQPPLEYVFFGTIKPYKRLDELLEHWPLGVPLTIMGYCSEPEHVTQLKCIIQRRGLWVNWTNEYVDEQELNQTLAHCRYVVMPHEDDSMISSGTFYHAASYGTNFICFNSKFARHKAQQHHFVHIVDKTGLPQQLSRVNYIPRREVMAQALKHYGQTAQQQAWKHVLVNNGVKPQLCLTTKQSLGD